MRSFRRNQNAEPANSLPPDLVTTFMAPPPERPASTEYPLVITWNSFTDSCATSVPPPSRARPPRPNPKKALFAFAPSIVRPEFTARCPLTESVPRLGSTWTVGCRSANRTKSRPAIGSAAISSSST